ncbi:Uncharacterized protein APZ42_021318 [Daphnia magna]|uniref:Uncharacterized protein n=1 Tax=Daphnia magna TaxID=35525 RepID=A0A164WSI9_9CRUS|nr:Uncharacterized protein APZ42_021318 [Daphnia magna]
MSRRQKNRISFPVHLSYVLQRQLIKSRRPKRKRRRKKESFPGPILKNVHPGPSEISRRLLPTHGDGPFIKKE